MAAMFLLCYFSQVPKPYLPQLEEEATSNEVREVQTINKKGLEGQEKPRRKHKSTNFHYDTVTRAKMGKYAAKKTTVML